MARRRTLCQVHARTPGLGPSPPDPGHPVNVGWAHAPRASRSGTPSTSTPSVLSPAGHFAHRDQPEAFNDAVLDFLADLPE